MSASSLQVTCSFLIFSTPPQQLHADVLRLPQHGLAAKAEDPVGDLDAAVGGELQGHTTILRRRDHLVGAPDVLADVHRGLGYDVYGDAKRLLLRDRTAGRHLASGGYLVDLYDSCAALMALICSSGWMR